LYFKRIGVTSTPSYFKPRSNRQIIQLLLEQFANCFDNEAEGYKRKELLALAAIAAQADAATQQRNDVGGRRLTQYTGGPFYRIQTLEVFCF
jgi:hypothetical protein